MKFATTGQASEFKRVPAGSHIAICNLIADVGLQPGTGRYPAPKHQIYVRFEVPGERTEYEKDGVKKEGPLTIGRYFTASMAETANLRQYLENWRGKAFTDQQASDFDVATILGQHCMLSVTETEANGKTYSNISAINALPKGTPKPAAENPLLFYDPENAKDFSKLPEWLQKKIGEQLKSPKSSAGLEDRDTAADDEFDDQSIPF